MKKGKKFFAILGLMGALLIAGSALAAAQTNPASIVSGLTGKSIADVTEERAAGKTYGAIANDAGKLDEFKAQMLEWKKSFLDERVKAGTLTQTQADQILAAMKDRQLTCDGSVIGTGRGCGAGLGQGKGLGMGNGGLCSGMGFGRQQ